MIKRSSLTDKAGNNIQQAEQPDPSTENQHIQLVQPVKLGTKS